jgi:preprotein translocase subunit SecY
MHHSRFGNFGRRHSTLVGLALLAAGIVLLIAENLDTFRGIGGGVTILASMCVTVALSLLARIE